MLLLDWHRLCFCFLCLFSTWLVILFYSPSFCKAQPFGVQLTSPSVLYSTFLAVPLPLIWAVLSQNDRHWVLSTIMLPLPLSLMLTSQPLPFASPLSDVIPLYPPFSSSCLATGNCWVFSSFPALYLLSFLCLLWCPLLRYPLTLALLFTIFSYLHWKYFTQIVSTSTNFSSDITPQVTSLTFTGTMGLDWVSSVFLLEAPCSFHPGNFLGFDSSYSLSFLNTSGFPMAVLMHSTLFCTWWT